MVRNVIDNEKSKFRAYSEEGDRRFVSYMDCLKGDMDTPNNAREGKLFLSPHFKGVANSALSVLVNVFIMAPIMCVFGTAFGVILTGGDWSTFGWSYLVMLPKAAGLAWLLVFFVARPLTGLVFSDVFKRLQSARKHAASSETTA